MQPQPYAPATPLSSVHSVVDESGASGVSWGAIFAGAIAAAALSLILLSLGFGLGFSAVSPWSNAGPSATSIGVSTIVWLLVTSILASGMGGYLAGRLRTKWASIHSDEVYFRDTAHGFLAWATATLVTAAFLTSAASSAIGTAVNAAGAVTGSALSGAASVAGATTSAMASDRDSAADVQGYFSDALLRSTQPNAAPVDSGARTEVARILATSVRAGTLDPNDRAYLAQVVAARAGVPQPEAEKRIDDLYAKARAAAAKAQTELKQAADTARKAAAYTALWTFIALLSGAFTASFAATWGGRRRDSDVVVVRSTRASV